MQTMTNESQKRAKAGGEWGPNGEWYQGGAFIATTEMPKRQRMEIEKARTGRVIVDVGVWEVPQPGMMSIMDRLGGTFMSVRGDFQETVAAYYMEQGTTSEYIGQVRELAAKFKAGDRWAAVSQYPEVASYADGLRMIAAGLPVPNKMIARGWYSAFELA